MRPEIVLERELARRVAERPGFSPDAHLVAIPASTPEQGWQELVRIQNERPSPISRQLAAAFAAAEGEERDFVVGGPHAALADRVLRDGLVRARVPRLAGVRVLLVSPEPPSEELRALASELDVELLHQPWEPARGPR